MADDLSFAKDILPLFRQIDIDHMEPFGVLLNDYKWMAEPANAQQVHDYLTGELEPRMPPGGPFWSDAQIDVLDRWIKGGCLP